MSEYLNGGVAEKLPSFETLPQHLSYLDMDHLTISTEETNLQNLQISLEGDEQMCFELTFPQYYQIELEQNCTVDDFYMESDDISHLKGIPCCLPNSPQIQQTIVPAKMENVKQTKKRVKEKGRPRSKIVGTPANEACKRHRLKVKENIQKLDPEIIKLRKQCEDLKKKERDVKMQLEFFQKALKIMKTKNNKFPV